MNPAKTIEKHLFAALRTGDSKPSVKGRRMDMLAETLVNNPEYRKAVIRIAAAMLDGHWSAAHGMVDCYAACDSQRRRVPQANVYDRMSDREKLKLPVGAILPERIANALMGFGARTVGDLLGCEPGELLAIMGLGETGLREIFEAVGKLGFHREGYE